MLDEMKKKELERLALQIRIGTVESIKSRGFGHIGGSLSIADTLAVLYGAVMKFDPKNPKWEGRDKLLFSKGHSCLAQYAALAELGYFPRETLKTLKCLGSILQGHPDVNKTPGVEANTGSLGQGLSIANGMALAMRLDGNKSNRVYCIMGDGEMAEGQIWEAAMSAAHFKLDNLRLIVDNNRLQLDGPVEKIMSVYPIEDKFKAFNWEVFSIDGNSVDEIAEAFAKADSVVGKPVAIVAKTTKGRGVSVFENKVEFHGGRPSPEQYSIAYKELDAQIEQLEK